MGSGVEPLAITTRPSKPAQPSGDFSWNYLSVPDSCACFLDGRALFQGNAFACARSRDFLLYVTSSSRRGRNPGRDRAREVEQIKPIE